LWYCKNLWALENLLHKLLNPKIMKTGCSNNLIQTMALAFVLFSCSLIEKDPCDTVTCLNNGTCIDGNCDCPSGYYGDFCENELAGQAMFWLRSDLGCGNITVTLDGSSAIIDGYYSGGAPACAATSTATFTRTSGTYSYSASCSGLTWSGTVVISAGGCYKLELTK
jgi:EGF-like domain